MSKPEVDDDTLPVTLTVNQLKRLLREVVREEMRSSAPVHVRPEDFARRLANIEAILLQLLERRRANVRSSVKRTVSMRERLRDEAARHPQQPSERHVRMAQELRARIAKRQTKRG